MAGVPANVQEVLGRFGQTHLLRWWDQLDSAGQQDLLNQIDQIDFDQVIRVWNQHHTQKTVDSASSAGRIDKAAAPVSVVRQPESEEDHIRREAAGKTGERLLSEGKVAVITVAGGQGSRLGFEHPKGMFPVGPVSERSLFQIFAEQILARQRRHGASILWMIMTSSATHAETVSFFEQHRFFGLDPRNVVFFQQGSMPAVDAASGKILMDGPCTISLSPDGHGGLISALQKAGLLKRMEAADIEHVFYHQVDNPTVILCDPVLLGFHHQARSSLTTNVVRKSSPTERMGVLVDIDGQVEIIEYSELTSEQAAKEDANGQWIFWAGNTAIHVFARSFLEELSTDGCRLELHVARKNVPYINEEGQLIQPSDSANPNGIKLERFIFDALPMASVTLIVEGNRSREFNPVKNRDGADSPATSRAALSAICRSWLASTGVHVAEGTAVEVSPLTALDAEELAAALKDGRVRLEQLTGNAG